MPRIQPLIFRFARRAQSPEFHRIHDEVKQLAFESSSMFRAQELRGQELRDDRPIAAEAV